LHQIKLFKGVESNLHAMEDEINDWLRQSNARVVHVFGNIAPQSAKLKPEPTRAGPALGFSASDVLVAVVFES
jgi:hypothetical protein